MAQLYQCTDWRFGIRHSCRLTMVWSAAPEHQATQRQKLAYAQQLGKPIRLLVIDAARLPEDLCAGYGDLQVARVASQAECARQIQQWLAALPPRKEDER